MFLFERAFTLPGHSHKSSLLEHLDNSVEASMPHDAIPLRLAVTETTEKDMNCEMGMLEGFPEGWFPEPDSIFNFTKRTQSKNDQFNIALIVPTGIGAEIGGHAGDATPVARLLGGVCDLLITHPNVVNASDINEMPENTLYVEGSILSRFLMGAIGLRPVQSNRVLVILDDNKEQVFVNAAINAVSAARASYGLDCPEIILIEPQLIMRSVYTDSGSAAGEIENLDYVFKVLEENKGDYDAVALSTVITVPHHYHQEYFNRQGEMINPWGGVEAMLTHAISSVFNVPSAHSPMFESPFIANMDPGVVEPRMAAEAVSMTFLQCVLKGLRRSPRIVTEQEEMETPQVLNAGDVSCLIIPDGCLGLPTLAALEQGFPVIAVRENKNLMKNDLSKLPWIPGQFHRVDNYWEAVGVIDEMRDGMFSKSMQIPNLPWEPGRQPTVRTKREYVGFEMAKEIGLVPSSVRRPIAATPTRKRKFLTGEIPWNVEISRAVGKKTV